MALWLLGYPDQALRQQHAADTLAQEVAHPPSLACTRMLAAIAHQLRRETHAAHEQAEALIALATEQGCALLLAMGGILRGGTRTALGQRGKLIGQIRRTWRPCARQRARWSRLFGAAGRRLRARGAGRGRACHPGRGAGGRAGHGRTLGGGRAISPPGAHAPAADGDTAGGGGNLVAAGIGRRPPL